MLSRPNQIIEVLQLFAQTYSQGVWQWANVRTDNPQECQFSYPVG